MMCETMCEMRMNERKYLIRTIPSTGALGVKCLDFRAESLINRVCMASISPKAGVSWGPRHEYMNV